MKKLFPPESRIGISALFGLLVIIYTMSNSGGFHIIDEASRFAVTESLALRGSVDTNAIAWTQWVNSPREAQGDFGPNGDVYSKKGPAQPILTTIWYLLLLVPTRLMPGVSDQLKASFGMLQWTMLFSGLVTAATAALVWRTTVRLGYVERVGAALALLFGVATIAWPYATYLLAEPLSSLCLLVCFYGLLTWRNELSLSLLPTAQTDKLSTLELPPHIIKWLWISGIAAGFAVATTIVHILLIIVFGLYWLIVAGQVIWPTSMPIGRKALTLIKWGIPIVVPIVITVLLMVAYNIIRFGIFWNTGYQIFDGEFFITPLWEGVWGLLFSPYRSFFLHSPIFIISLFALPLFYRKHRPEALTFLGVTVVIVALYGKWWMWWGGYAWGPRFLVPLAPFWILFLAPLVQGWFPQDRLLDSQNEAASVQTRVEPTGMKALTIAGALLMAVLSVAVQVSAVTVNFVNFETELRGIFPTDWLEPLKFGPPATAATDIAYSPIVGQWVLWLRDPVHNTDLAWLYSNGDVLWTLLLIGGAAILIAAITFGIWWRHEAANQSVDQPANQPALQPAEQPLPDKAAKDRYGLPGRTMAGLLPLVSAVAVMIIWTGQVSGAPRYGTLGEGLRAILSKVDYESAADDAIITVAPYHYTTLMNWFQSTIPVYGYAPDSLQYAETQALLSSVVEQHPRIWFVTAGLPPADANNGVERWLAQVSYKADDQWYNDFRIVRYATDANASLPHVREINLTLADVDNRVKIIQSQAAAEATAGQTLPIALTFQVEEANGHSLRWFVQLLNSEGQPVAMTDTSSQGGYRALADLPLNIDFIEKIGLQMPTALPAGQYQLIAGLYNPEREGARLTVANAEDHVKLSLVDVP